MFNGEVCLLSQTPHRWTDADPADNKKKLISRVLLLLMLARVTCVPFVQLCVLHK